MKQMWKTGDIIVYSFADFYIVENTRLQGAVFTHGDCLRASRFNEIVECMKREQGTVLV